MSRWTAHGTDWQAVRQQVLAEEIACHRCGSTVFDPRPRTPMSKSVDHIIPRARGGTNHRTNLRLAHYGPCNSAYGNTIANRPRLLRRPSRPW